MTSSLTSSNSSSPPSSQKSIHLSSSHSLSNENPSSLPRSFHTFLTERANPSDPSKKTGGGFTVSDYLKYRYVEFITAEGLWSKIYAFVCLGGLGYFFSESVDDSNREVLKKESAFYHQCCKVQACYQSFAKNPDEKLDALKEAYETLLKMGKDSTDYESINQIINQRLPKGACVGRAILEKVAEKAFTSHQGKFNETSILSTIKGQLFVDHMNNLNNQGYRVAVTEDENEAYKFTSGARHLPEFINDNNRKIFTAYAQAYRHLVKKENDRFSEILCKNLTPSTEFVKQEMNRHQENIQKLIADPENEITSDKMPLLLQQGTYAKDLEEIRGTYHELISEEANKNIIEKDSTHLLETCQQVEEQGFPLLLGECSVPQIEYEKVRQTRDNSKNEFLKVIENMREATESHQIMDPKSLLEAQATFNLAQKKYEEDLKPLLEVGKKIKILETKLANIEVCKEKLNEVKRVYDEKIQSCLTPEELSSVNYVANNSEFERRAEDLATTYTQTKIKIDKKNEDFEKINQSINQKQKVLIEFGFSRPSEVSTLKYKFPESYSKDLERVLEDQAELNGKIIRSLEKLSMPKESIRDHRNLLGQLQTQLSKSEDKKNFQTQNLQDLQASPESSDNE